MSIELIITQGSNAGSAAPIHPGYYLVGRSSECQIRPKSRSVSRRHCLLLRNEDGFGALDLKSTSGTFVNGSKLETHAWRALNDGDELRFGKVAFTVSINEPVLASSGELKTSESRGSSLDQREGLSDAVESQQTPESWQNFDVANFLDAEDTAEYEERYGQKKNHSDRSEAKSTDEAPGPDDPSVLEDPPLESATHDTAVGSDLEASQETAELSSSEADEIEVDSVPKRRPPRKQIDHQEYKTKSRRSMRFPSFSMATGLKTADWKTMAAIGGVVISLGLASYQLYRLQRGPDIQVRQNLD